MIDTLKQPAETPADKAKRPERIALARIPEIPEVQGEKSDEASVHLSQYRSRLSRFRTGLSEHRTDLSEFRTDLSQHRTDLSDHRTEMSMRRTGMSFQRTRMSADRTLMSEMRTSLSLIGFGFTIYQTFKKLHQAGVILQSEAPRNFGLALIVLGVLLLVGGIVRHLQYVSELRGMRHLMAQEGLVHAETRFPVSMTLIVAVLLVALGVAAFLSIVFDLALFR